DGGLSGRSVKVIRNVGGGYSARSVEVTPQGRKRRTHRQQTEQTRGSIMDSNKEKALEAALSQIERQFGKGTVMRMGDREHVPIPAISTGSLGLDIALGIGGLPRGRICEIYGPESSGKTTLTL